MGRLDGRVVIVTGGARGQGEAEVRLCAAEGARVVVSDVLAGEGTALAAELGDSVAFFRHDVSSEEEWAAAVAFTLERFGGLNGLVNNAGIALGAPSPNTRSPTTNDLSPSIRSACSSASVRPSHR